LLPIPASGREKECITKPLALSRQTEMVESGESRVEGQTVETFGS
jgi:hypothetical protein